MHSGQDTEKLIALAEDYALRHAMRLTKPRKLLILHLAEANKAISAEELWFIMRSKGFFLSMSGVYNSLNWLKKAGLVKELENDKKRIFLLIEIQKWNLKY